MKIAITAESTIDLTPELIEKYDIKIVPFGVLLGEESYLDGEVTPSMIFDYVKKNKILPKTNAVNQYQYEEFFKKQLESYDAVIHFSLSSEMSSACSNAIKAAENMDNVYVLDTRTLSTGIALLAIYANKLALQGLSAKEVFEKTRARVQSSQVSFIINRLDYLYKGGRCSALQLFGANLLKLKPQISVKDGKMGVAKKYRGKLEEVLREYCRDILASNPNPDLEEVFITYTTAEPSSVEELKSALSNRGFKNIHITTAGSTITSHCGESTLGILFLNK